MTSPFFDRPAHEFALTGPVNLGQLGDEVRDAIGNPDLLFALTMVDDTELFWVSPIQDGAVVRRVIEEHVPDWDWGTPKVLLAYAELEKRIFDDPDCELSTEELTALVRGLVLKSHPSQG